MYTLEADILKLLFNQGVGGGEEAETNKYSVIPDQQMVISVPNAMLLRQ